MKKNMVAIKIDETEYWNDSFLRENNISNIFTVYVYDPNKRVHVCSLSPSVELWPCMTYAVPVPGESLPDDVDMEIEEATSHDVVYTQTMHRVPDEDKIVYDVHEECTERELCAALRENYPVFESDKI